MEQAVPQTILVVDDEAFIRAFICRRLERKGYHTLQAADPDHAYQALKRERPDLVISDVIMPGGTGFDLCRKLRAEGDKTPFIFLTLLEPDDTPENAVLSPADHLTKPVDLNVLEACVAARLAKRAA